MKKFTILLCSFALLFVACNCKDFTPSLSDTTSDDKINATQEGDTEALEEPPLPNEDQTEETTVEQAVKIKALKEAYQTLTADLEKSTIN